MWTCSLRARRAESFSPGLREKGTAGLHAVGPDGLVALSRARHDGVAAVSIALLKKCLLRRSAPVTHRAPEPTWAPSAPSTVSTAPLPIPPSCPAPPG